MIAPILILGATGTVGRPVVEQLVQAGVPVRAFSRNAARATALLPKGAEVAEGDARDRDSLRVAMQGVERLLLNSPATPDLLDVQTHAIEIAREAGVQHVVKVSALGANPASTNPIGRMHGRAEDALEASGLQWTHLRPHNFMDNFLDYAPDIKAGRLYFAAADGKLPQVDARDIASVAVVTLTREGHHRKKYPISGPEAYSFYEIADIFTRALGYPVQYRPITTEEVVRREVEVYGKPRWMAEGLANLQTYWAAGKSAETYATVRALTGEPGIYLAQFVEDHKAAFRR